MKKLFLTMCLTTMLVSCKPSSPKKLYHFDEEVDGIILRHDLNNKKFEVTLKNKEIFIFTSIKTHGSYFSCMSPELTYVDSIGEQIDFNSSNERGYRFENQVSIRVIEIKYSDIVYNAINAHPGTLEVQLYERTYFDFDAL